MSRLANIAVAPASESPAPMEPQLRHHLSVFFFGGVLTISRVVAGFIRIKYVAFALGTAGVGFISQAGQMQLLGLTIGSLSMAAGIVNRMGAGANATPEGRRRLLSTALTVQLAMSAIFLLVALAGHAYFSKLVFAEDSPLARNAFVAVTLSVPFAVLVGGYADAVLFGIFRYDLYVKASLAATVCGTAGTIGLIAWLGLVGAFWGMCAMSVLQALFDVIALSRAQGFREMFQLGFDWGEARALVKICFVMLAVAGGGYLSRLWIQARVIADLGIDANGLLHVPLAITSYYTPFLSNAMWGRLHPVVTRTGDTADGQRELAIALRLTALVAGTVIVTVLALKTTLVQLAYSTAFLPAVSLLPVQLVGDLFYFVALTCSIYLLGVSRLRHYLVGWTMYNVVMAAVSTVLIGRLGVHAVPVGYTLTTVVLGSAGLAWFARRNRETERATTFAAIGGCFAAVVGQSVLAAWDLVPVVQFAIAAAMLAIMARVFFSGGHGLQGFRMLLGGAPPVEHA